jgi:lysylphosphatidylglycerol synthetase-like protein (DUF2156 family)
MSRRTVDHSSGEANMRNILVIAAIVLGAILVTAFRLVLLMLGSVLYIYLLPGIVAQRRHHLRQQQIYIVTALAGWLVVPWVLALLYASMGEQGAVLADDMPVVAGLLND